MDCQFTVSEKVPEFKLHFEGSGDNNLHDIVVSQGGKVVQKITGHEVDLGDLYPAGLDRAVQSVDANFDGYQDLQLLSDCGGTGNCDYDFYLFDPKQNRFVYNKFLSALGSPEFNVARKEVTGWNTSAVDRASSIYRLQNGRYVEIEREVSDENGTRFYERRDGNMVLARTEKRVDQ
jgi:hypothetical protein